MTAKDMTAKEMFEELGYISLTKNYIKGELKTIVYKNEVNKDWIKFYADKQQFIEMSGNGIFVQELKAINQQVKELGWLDE